eukprot:11053461-Prorocentrum_lima.AAC.1
MASMPDTRCNPPCTGGGKRLRRLTQAEAHPKEVITLPVAQAALRPPDGFRLKTVSGDGGCFFHCLVAAGIVGDRTEKDLRDIVGLPAPQWAEEEQMCCLAKEFNLFIICWPCDLARFEEGVQQAHVRTFGDHSGTPVRLLHWTRKAEGVHFDLLVETPFIEPSGDTVIVEARGDTDLASQQTRVRTMVPSLSEAQRSVVLPPNMTLETT